MRYYRCKCGEEQSWSSMGVPRCVVCVKCGSALAESPNSHAEPADHEWRILYNQTTGEPYKVCKVCCARELTLTGSAPATAQEE